MAPNGSEGSTRHWASTWAAERQQQTGGWSRRRCGAAGSERGAGTAPIGPPDVDRGSGLLRAALTRTPEPSPGGPPSQRGWQTGAGPRSWRGGGCVGILAGEWVGRDAPGEFCSLQEDTSRDSQPPPKKCLPSHPAARAVPLPHRHSPCLRLFKGMVLWPMKSFLEEAS